MGPENDAYILRAVRIAKLTVCGWGKIGALHDRGRKTLNLIRSAGVVPHALKLNADGSPQHPLYLPYHLEPFPIAP